eukprot:COSAG02_NODE_6596_length_3471_cov_1.285884_2_plen_90_part_00
MALPACCSCHRLVHLGCADRVTCALLAASGRYAALRPSLDEVRWVIAHECAHIKHEDGLGRGLGLGLGLVAYHGMHAALPLQSVFDLAR